MFGKYFGNRYFGPTYWGSGEPFTGGGPKVKRKLSQAEIEGLQVIYPDVTFEEVEYEVAPVEIVGKEEVITGIDVSVLERESELYTRVFSLTEVEKRLELEEAEDIGLILAIIEAMD